MTKHQALGRGLNALFQEASQPYDHKVEGANLIYLKPFELRPSPFQPRQFFHPEELENLVNSIREKGILQPIIARKTESTGVYEIIAGERRWRAATTLNLEEIPVVIKDCSNQEALEFALIENIQRKDLDPIEEAEGFSRLIQEFHYTQEQLAQSIGKSRSHVANTIRLLQLPEAIKQFVRSGKISAGHARALLTADNPEKMVDKILNEGLNVRDAERESKSTLHLDNGKQEQEAEVAQLLTQQLGLHTTVRITRKGGVVSIHFETFEQLDDLMARLRQASQ